MVSCVPDASDLHAELAGGVRDAPGAWRFVRSFAARYATAIADGDGFGEKDLLAAEARLRVRLPGALRDAYALIGKRRDLTASQDRLLAPDQLYVDDTGGVLVFRVECQHVAEWGIPLSAATEPDPPVVFRVRPATPAENSWQPFLDRVSLACVEMVLSEWLFSGVTPADNRDLDDEAVSMLERQFRRLAMPEYPLWAGGGSVSWYEGPGAILRADARTWLWAGAISQEAIAAVRRALPGEWLMDGGSLTVSEQRP